MDRDVQNGVALLGKVSRQIGKKTTIDRYRDGERGGEMVCNY